MLDGRGPFFRSRLVAELGDGLTYREALTVDARRAIQRHLVHDWGPQSDPNTAPRPGKIAFAYPKTALPTSKRAAFILHSASSRHEKRGTAESVRTS